MRCLLLCAAFASMFLLTGCVGIVGFWMTAGGVAAIPVAGYELTKDRSVDHNIKPYGARWVKEGMTRESRKIDWIVCGGAENLREGYELQYGMSHKEFFDGLNSLRNQLWTCMETKGYVYRNPSRPGLEDECNAGACLYP